MIATEVLILSDAYDFASDLVALRLHSSGVKFLRLNRDSLPEARVSLDPAQGQMEVEIRDQRWVLGKDLRSVLFRQPVYLRNSPARPLSPMEQLERTQWAAFARSLVVLKGAAWMNHPVATFAAEIKPYQLNAAAEIGFQVPRTRITNSVRFIADLVDSEVISKPLDTVLIHQGDDVLFTYSNITKVSGLGADDLQRAPIIAQELITDKVDWRVTMVGHRAFAAKILARTGVIEGDWRITPKADLSFVSDRLPDSITSACFSLMKRLDLTYGGIDLVQRGDQFFFMEINPTGEFAWLVTDERSIDLEIARWLTNPI